MFQSDRQFRLWDYKVSHNQALIRSPRKPDTATNIDVIFWGVERLNLPTNFDGLRISKGGGNEFVIETKEKRFVVVAGGCKVLENELDIFESSLEGFAATDETRDLGSVLAHS